MAKSAGCGSNLRNMNMAMMLYAEMNNEYFPPRRTNNNIWPQLLSDMKDISPIEDERSAFYCPNSVPHPTTTRAMRRWYPGYGVINPGPTAVTMPSTNVYIPAKLSVIIDPAGTCLLADSKYNPTPAMGSYTLDWYSTGGGNFADRHTGRRTNILAVEGHVESYATDMLNTMQAGDMTDPPLNSDIK